ncbi:MAG: serine hydrolase domain-containing protein [Bacteroidota bacterium]
MQRLILLVLISNLSCEQPEELPASFYDQPIPFADSSQSHPDAIDYQQILDVNQRKGMVGATLLVKDSKGLWVGASGFADIENNVPVQPHHVFFIASISKVFTAAATYRAIDQGFINSVNEPANPFLNKEIVDEIDNLKEATLAHLLSHRSGIRDFYTTQFDLDRINTDQDWTKEEVLEYIYGKSADFSLNSSYSYSNTNFLLLSMILENVLERSFEKVYQDLVFNPLGLASAYYSENQIIPPGAVKGYADIHNNGTFVESGYLYEDELGIGGDGGVAINAYHLAVFLENLVNESFISSEQQQVMTDWFTMPEDFHWHEYGQIQNGYGLEKFDTKFGTAIGHTGGIDGFSTYGFYFPEDDRTYVLLSNSASLKAGDIHVSIFEEVLEIMFEDK